MLFNAYFPTKVCKMDYAIIVIIIFANSYVLAYLQLPTNSNMSDNMMYITEEAAMKPRNTYH